MQYLLPALGFVLALFFVAQILKERRPPGSTLAWLLTILMVPYVGIPLYLIIGKRKILRIAAAKKELYHPKPFSRSEITVDDPLEKLLFSWGLPLKGAGNRVRFLGSGEEAFETIVRMIEDAQASIHITTFALHHDIVGRMILNLLIKKARAGVQVRVLLDGFGSFWLKRSVVHALKEAGGRYAFFTPAWELPFKGRSNLRNHRKIIVVDGKRSLLGGMNLTAKYMGPAPSAKRWVDLCVYVEGPVSFSIETVFRSDWQYVTRENISLSRIDPTLAQITDPSLRNSILQTIASGPDVPGDPLYEVSALAIFRATRRIWIATPYFIPDETLARGLELAARRGVDVRILVPRKSDNWLADLSRTSFLRQIEMAGGKICFYETGMMHAKVAVMDDHAMVGSANLDMRSLFLNYEIGLLFYTPADIELLTSWFESLLKNTTQAFPISKTERLRLDGIGRILAPLL